MVSIETFTNSEAHLIKIVNNSETEVGLLLDNGELANGDEIANDNVYSGKFIFNESSSGEIKFKAKGTVSSTSSGYSSPLTFTVYSELSSQDVSTLFKIQSSAKTQLMTYLGGNVGNIGNATTQLVSWLQTQPGVAGVERNGNTGILIKYTSGISGGILFSIADAAGRVTTLGGSEIADTLIRNKRTIPTDKQTTGINDFYGDNYKYNSDNY